jgi:predicted RNase H-like nuclease (RuvC/YqgF family)
MDYLEKLCAEYSKLIEQGKKYCRELDELKTRAQEVRPGKEPELLAPTEERRIEIERLEKRCKENEERQHELETKIAKIKEGKRGT